MKRERVPAEACLELAEEIDGLVHESKRRRLELLKEFWVAERGKTQNENPHRAANNFKQAMFKARHRANLGPVSFCELRDFRDFLKRKLKG